MLSYGWMKGFGEDEHVSRFDSDLVSLCRGQWSHSSTVQFYVKQLNTINMFKSLR